MNTHAPAKSTRSASPVSTPAHTAILRRKCACGGDAGVDGECAECRRKRLQRVRRTNHDEDPVLAPPIVHEVLHSPGHPLDASTRKFMESRFGHDFSRVRVHTDSWASESARAVNAAAYTVGRDVVFAAGQYAPHTQDGRRLVAHELTHVVQQAGASAGIPDHLIVGTPGHAAELEAGRTAQAVADVGRAPAHHSQSAIHVQRLTDPEKRPRTTPCPTAVHLGPMRQYNHENISRANQEKYRTYLSNIATMTLEPGPDHTGHFFPEALTEISSDCPSSMGANHCVGADFLPLATPTTFIDGHVTKSERSQLEGTGKSSCKVVCQQHYSCDSVLTPLQGTFRITRNYKAGTYKKTDGTTVHVTTGTVDKVELPRTSKPAPLAPPGRPSVPDMPRTLPQGQDYA